MKPTIPYVKLKSLETLLAEKTNQTILNPKKYGAVADGLSHKISDALPSVTLADVQVLDATATLNDEVDWYAIQKCIKELQSLKGGTVELEASTYVTSKPLVLSGFAISDGFDMGGIVLKGTSARGTIIKATHTGSAIKRNQSMFNSIENLTVMGKGKADIGSIGIELIGTGGNNFFKDVYIHDFEKGLTTYDITLISATNLAIRNCKRGIEGQYNSDIFTFIGSRFDYCDNAIYLGQPTTAHPSGSQEENCWKFIGCRISNNLDNAILIDDYGASNIEFDSCYFEGNVKEGKIGNTTTLQPAPACITFRGCYWTGYSSSVQGYLFTGASFSKFEGCKVDGSTLAPYNPFINLQHSGNNLIVDQMKFGSGITSFVNYGGRTYNYNPINGSKLIINSKTYGKYAVDNLPEIETPLDFTFTGATGKKLMSLRKASSSTEATLSELFLKDTNGVMVLEGNLVFLRPTDYTGTPTVDYRGTISKATAGVGGVDKIQAVLKMADESYKLVTLQAQISGTTAQRPVLGASTNIAFQYFDTTLDKPIWWNGTAWKDSTGTVV